MANIAISELETSATTLKDDDYVLVSSKNDNNSFTSAKMTGDKLKNSVKSSISVATATANGLMSSNDKSKLDELTIENILKTIYPIGSVYIDSSGSSTCPIASLISGSTWLKIGTSIITGVNGTVSFASKGTGTIPVKGNGKNIGVIYRTTENGSTQVVEGSLIGFYNSSAGRSTVAAKTPLDINIIEDPTDASNQGKLITYLGITNLSNDSGIVADVSSFSDSVSGTVSSNNILVNIWKRTN